MWPGGPPLPEWIQPGVLIRATPGNRQHPAETRAEITRISEAYISFLVSGTLTNMSRMEHFLHDWYPAEPPRIDSWALDLPYFWPEGRPDSRDINRLILSVLSPLCSPLEKAVIIEVGSNRVFFSIIDSKQPVSYGIKRENFIRQFRPDISFDGIPYEGLIEGRVTERAALSWHTHLLEDPF